MILLVILFYSINRKGGEDIPMSNNWLYDYFINEVKAIRRNSIPKPLTYDYMPGRLSGKEHTDRNAHGGAGG